MKVFNDYLTDYPELPEDLLHKLTSDRLEDYLAGFDDASTAFTDKLRALIATKTTPQPPQTPELVEPPQSAKLLQLVPLIKPAQLIEPIEPAKEKKTQGQSKASTPGKVAALTHYFNRFISAYLDSNKDHYPQHFRKESDPYCHFDMNCGTGYNDDVDCIGSPGIFLNAAAENRLGNFNVIFCDIDPKAIETLEGRIYEKSDRIKYRIGNNKTLLNRIPTVLKGWGITPRYARGSILIDFNGVNEVDWDSINMLHMYCPRIDVILHFNHRTSKMARLNTKDPEKLQKHLSVRERINQIRKEQWLVRQMHGSFIVLVATNGIKLDALESEGFYRVYNSSGEETEKGTEALDKLDMKEADYNALYPKTT